VRSLRYILLNAQHDKFFDLSYTLAGESKMNIRIVQITAFTALLVSMVLFTACGIFGGGEAEPTRAPTNANNPPAQGQQDQLDDSIDIPADNPPADDNEAVPPGQDPLDDSAVPPAGGAGDLPQTQNGMVVLTNTSWVLASDVNQTYMFCSNGNWQIKGGAAPQSGTYQVQDKTLTLTSNNNATTYQMNWNEPDATLELAGGSGPIQLEFDGAAQCS
jgi:hypothetical protein